MKRWQGHVRSLPPGPALVDRVCMGVEGLLERLHFWFSLGGAVVDSRENCIVCVRGATVVKAIL